MLIVAPLVPMGQRYTQAYNAFGHLKCPGAQLTIPRLFEIVNLRSCQPQFFSHKSYRLIVLPLAQRKYNPLYVSVHTIH